MNWKEEAIEKLRRYDAMRSATVNLPEELQRLELATRALQSPRFDTPRGSGESKREDAMINNIVTRQELELALDNAKSWLQSTDRALTVLPREEQLILIKLYIRPEKGAVDQLCQELELESSSIYRRRDKALKNFTLALYGIS